MASVSNFQTTLRRHNVIDALTFWRTKASSKLSVKAETPFLVMSCKPFRAQFRVCQVKNHVLTARESHDLNMVFVHLTTDSNSFAQKLCKNAAFHLAMGLHYLQKYLFMSSRVAIKLNLRPYIQRYTSPNENFEYSYPLI